MYVITFVNIILIGAVAAFLFLKTAELNSVNPLDMASIEELKTEAQSDTKDIIVRENIRKLDLVVRREWFTNQKIQTDLKNFLALAVIILILLIAIITHLKPVEISAAATMPRKMVPAGESLALLLTALMSVIAVNAFYFMRHQPSEKTPAITVATQVISQAVPQTSAEPMFLELSELANFWPAFRGMFNDGIAANHKPVTGWGENLEKSIKWTKPVPLPGYGSPIVIGNKLFVSGGDENKRALFCFDAETGELLWTHEAVNIAGSPARPPKVTDDTGYAASTPASNGKVVFAVFANGDLIAVDLDGKRLWAKNLGVPENMYGYCSSLLVLNNRLVVQYDNANQQVVYCIDASNGNVIWQNERKSDISWSSPTIIRLADRDIVVVLNCRDVEAFDLADGKTLWSNRIMGGEVAPSVTFSDGKVFLANQFVLAAAINAETGEILWRNSNIMLPDVSSPVAYKDMLFVFASEGTISCLDAKDGKTLWEKEVKNGFYSSPLVLGDRIVAFDLKGKMLVVKPDREDLIIEREEDLGKAVLSTPALSGNRMWVRTNTNEVLLIEGQ